MWVSRRDFCRYYGSTYFRTHTVARGQILPRCQAHLESREGPFFGILQDPRERAGSWSTYRLMQGCQVASLRSGRNRAWQGRLARIFQWSILIYMLVTDHEQGWLACSREGLYVCSGIWYQYRCTWQVGVGLTFWPPLIDTDLDARDRSE